MRYPIMVLTLVALSYACARGSEPLAPRTVEMRGELVASNAATVAAPFEGTVRRVRVRRGDNVGAGDVLIELTNPELDASLAIARAQREWASGKMSAAPGNDTTGVQEATVIAEQARAKRDRYQSLYSSHDVTRQELEAAENEHSAALRHLTNLRAGGRAASPRLARIELDKARAEETLAAARLEAMTLRAPLAGVVTRLDAAEGRRVPAGGSLADVIDTATLEARAAVDPDLLRVVHAGMSAEVRILTVPPRVLTDRIAYVVPFRPGQQGERRATVVVNVANPDRSLQPETPVMLTVKTP
jgi:HlyD family secretion protein